MRAEPRQFLLTVIIYKNEQENVFSWQDPEGTLERGKIDILGDEWDARWIQSDLSIALNVFKEVFETGELSEKSLQHMR